MVEALAAISLVGNVFQFIETGLKIISKGNEAYKSVSGVTEDNQNVNRVTNELHENSRSLSEGLSNCQLQREGPPTRSDEDARLIEIAQSCEKLAEDLIDRLEKYKVEPGQFRRLRSLRQAIEAAWKEKEMESLEATLRSYQRQLDTGIIVSLRHRFDELDSKSAERHEGLYQSASTTLETLSSFQLQVELKLQSIEDLIRRRTPSPTLETDPSEYSKENHTRSNTFLQVPQIIPPAHRDSSLHVAARGHNIKEIRRALDLPQTEIDARNQDGQTAIHISATAGDLKSTKYLWQRGASLGVEDRYGKTPLHYAASNNDLAMVRALLQHGAQDTIEDDDGKYATDYATDPFIRWMLQRGVDAKNTLVDKIPLIHFSTIGHVEGVTILLQENANLLARDEQGNSPLMLASKNGKATVVELLCVALSDAINAQNDGGNTALMLAAANGHVDVVNILINSGAEIDKQDKQNGYTALIQALHNSQWTVADLLSSAGSSLEIWDRRGDHPLGLFAKMGTISAVSWLLGANVYIDAQTSGGRTALLKAVEAGQDSVVALLLKSKPCTETRGGARGYTPLHSAAVRGNSYQVRTLLEAGANPNTVNKAWWSPLADASALGHDDVVKILLDNGAYIETRDDQNRTPLHTSVVSNKYSCTKLLLEYGAYSSPQDNARCTPLEKAVFGGLDGNMGMATLLIQHGAKLELKNGNGYTPLYRAVVERQLDYVTFLQENGADMNTTNHDGWTPLDEACFGGRLKAVKLFLKMGANTEAVSTRGVLPGRDGKEQGWTPIMRAAWQGHIKVTRCIIEAGANIHCKTQHGRTASTIAREHGKDDLFEYLQQIEQGFVK